MRLPMRLVALLAFVAFFASIVTAAESCDAPTDSSNPNCCAGFYLEADSESVSFCSPCALGFAKGEEGVQGCSICSLNTFSASEASTACSTCPEYTHTTVTGADECVCDAGAYREDSVSECVACPDGGNCAGGDALPTPKDGYYASLTTNYLFLECNVEEACVGGVCTDGYGGILCGECSDEYHMWSTYCLECPSPSVLPLAASFIGYVVLCATLMWAVQRPYYAVPYILVNFMQMAALLPKLVASFDSSLRTVLTALSIFNFNPETMALNCVISSSFLIRYAISVVLPPITVVFISISITVYSSVKKLKRIEKMGLKYDLKHAVMLFLVNLYVFMVITAFSFFDCTSQPDGTSTLDVAPSMECYSTEWYALVPVSLVPMVLYVFGVPLFYFRMLHKNRHRLMDDDEFSPKFAAKYGWLYLRYRDQYWYWEFLVIIRKLIVVGFVTMLSSYVAGLVIPIFVLLGALMMQLRFRPFRRKSADNAAVISLLIQVSMLFSVTMYQYRADAQFEYTEVIVRTVIAMLLLGGIVVLLMWWMRERAAVSYRIERKINNLDDYDAEIELSRKPDHAKNGDSAAAAGHSDPDDY